MLFMPFDVILSAILESFKVICIDHGGAIILNSLCCMFKSRQISVVVSYRSEIRVDFIITLEYIYQPYFHSISRKTSKLFFRPNPR